jgi:hypothetical protein
VAVVLFAALLDTALPLWQLPVKKLRRESLVEDAQLTRARAERGDAAAQAELCHLYDDGLGVPRDRSQELHWCQMAADLFNDLLACGSWTTRYSIGLTYRFGRNIAQQVPGHRAANKPDSPSAIRIFAFRWPLFSNLPVSCPPVSCPALRCSYPISSVQFSRYFFTSAMNFPASAPSMIR